MKVDVYNATTVTLGSLGAGDCFWCGDVLYIKTNIRSREGFGFMCVRLDKGIIDDFQDSTEVALADVKVVCGV